MDEGLHDKSGHHCVVRFYLEEEIRSPVKVLKERGLFTEDMIELRDSPVFGSTKHFHYGTI